MNINIKKLTSACFIPLAFLASSCQNPTDTTDAAESASPEQSTARTNELTPVDKIEFKKLFGKDVSHEKLSKKGPEEDPENPSDETRMEEALKAMLKEEKNSGRGAPFDGGRIFRDGKFAAVTYDSGGCKAILYSYKTESYWAILIKTGSEKCEAGDLEEDKAKRVSIKDGEVSAP